MGRGVWAEVYVYQLIGMVCCTSQWEWRRQRVNKHMYNYSYSLYFQGFVTSA